MANHTVAAVQACGARALAWFRRQARPLLALTFVIVIVAGVIYLYRYYPSLLESLKGYGYFGVFVISLVLNATIILPVSNMAVMMTLGSTLPGLEVMGMSLPAPLLVGVIGGVGAAVGEMVGYLAGRSGRELVAKSRMYSRVEMWVGRWGWVAVFIFSVVPFVFDLVGIAAGVLRMPVWRFFTACWLGRTVLYVAMVSAAAYGLRFIPGWLQ